MKKISAIFVCMLLIASIILATGTSTASIATGSYVEGGGDEGESQGGDSVPPEGGDQPSDGDEVDGGEDETSPTGGISIDLDGQQDEDPPDLEPVDPPDDTVAEDDSRGGGGGDGSNDPSNDDQDDESEPVSPTIQLVVSAPSNVIEDESFTVTVTAEGNPVEGAIVEFLTETFVTNSEGEVELIAPSIEDGTSFIITASHDSYISSSASVNVFEQVEEDQDKGWVNGQIYDELGDPVIGARVDIILSDNTVITIFTDGSGYRALLPIGTYALEISKQGYHAYFSDVTINKNDIAETEFTLETSAVTYQDSSSDDYRDLIEAAIDAGIFAQKVSGEIEIVSADESHRSILYNTELSVDAVTFQENEVSLIISSETMSDTIVAFRLYDQENLLDIGVKFDNNEIERVSFVDIFNLVGSGEEQAKFTRLLTDGEDGIVAYVLVYIPHFSEHTITISSIAELIEALGGVTAFIMYITISVIMVFVFFSPMLSNIARRRMIIRKRK